MTSTAHEKVKLSELIKIKHGYAFKGKYFKDYETDNILLTPGNFAIGGGFQLKKVKYYDGPIPESFILKPQDLVVTMTDLSKAGDTLGYPALVPFDRHKKFLHNQRLGFVEIKSNKLSKYYLFYLMCTRDYQKYIVSTSSGSTVKHTSPDRILEYSFSLPSLTVQDKIATVLGRYDELILKSLRRIEILDEAARLLYRDYFSRTNAKWEDLPLSALTDLISRGISPKYDIEGDSLVINQRCIRDSKIDLSNARRQSKKVSENKLLKSGDIVINSTGVGTLGRVAQVEGTYENITADSHVTIVRFRSDLDKYYFGAALLDKQTEFEHLGTGATGQTELSRTAIGEVLVPVPEPAVIEEIGSKIKPMREQVSKLQAEIKLLTQARTMLIPRLISEEITV